MFFLPSPIQIRANKVSHCLLAVDIYDVVNQLIYCLLIVWLFKSYHYLLSDNFRLGTSPDPLSFKKLGKTGRGDDADQEVP